MWPTWADIISSEVKESYNYGRCAAGNFFIYQSLIEAIIRHKIDKNELEDGDYKVHILVGEELELFAARNLYIRSADTPDQETWKKAERLVYDLGKSPSAALTASQLRSENYFQRPLFYINQKIL
jgi:hypothetical protein